MISDYAGLLSGVATWAIRSGDTQFEAAVPGFVQLAESMFNQGAEGMSAIRTRDMEVGGTLVLVDGAAALPADFLEFREVRNAAGDILTQTVPTSADQRYQFVTSGRPAKYAIKGNTIVVYPTSSETLSTDYYQAIPPLSDANPTNWLLQKSPSLYLFGSLIYAATFMEDDAALARFGNLYERAAGGLTGSDLRAKYIRATSRSRGYRV